MLPLKAQGRILPCFFQLLVVASKLIPACGGSQQASSNLGWWLAGIFQLVVVASKLLSGCGGGQQAFQLVMVASKHLPACGGDQQGPSTCGGGQQASSSLWWWPAILRISWLTGNIAPIFIFISTWPSFLCVSLSSFVFL